VNETGRLLERLQQRVLALVAHRLGGLDHEDPLLALEGAVGSGADHLLAHLLDHVLGAAREQPYEVGVRRGIEQGTAAGVVRVGSPGGEDLRRKGTRRGALAGPARSAEQIGVRWPGGKRGAERHPCPRLVLRAALDRSKGCRGHGTENPSINLGRALERHR
jgi:hypothetical protein